MSMRSASRRAREGLSNSETDTGKRMLTLIRRLSLPALAMVLAVALVQPALAARPPHPGKRWEDRRLYLQPERADFYDGCWAAVRRPEYAGIYAQVYVSRAWLMCRSRLTWDKFLETSLDIELSVQPPAGQGELYKNYKSASCDRRYPSSKRANFFTWRDRRGRRWNVCGLRIRVGRKHSGGPTGVSAAVGALKLRGGGYSTCEPGSSNCPELAPYILDYF
jgi:hypothetical protein